MREAIQPTEANNFTTGLIGPHDGACSAAGSDCDRCQFWGGIPVDPSGTNGLLKPSQLMADKLFSVPTAAIGTIVQHGSQVDAESKDQPGGYQSTCMAHHPGQLTVLNQCTDPKRPSGAHGTIGLSAAVGVGSSCHFPELLQQRDHSWTRLAWRSEGSRWWLAASRAGGLKR